MAALRAFVHGQAGGLVDDQHQPVAVEQPAHHIFRSHWFLPSFAGTGITSAPMNDSTNTEKPRGWWGRLTAGLKRTSSSLGSAIADLVTKRKLDAAMVEEIEEVL